jgi:hypothetical protein
MNQQPQHDKIKFTLGLNTIPSLTQSEWNAAYRAACRTGKPVHGLTREQLCQATCCFPYDWNEERIFLADLMATK